MNYSDNSLRKDEIDRQINQMLLRLITQLPQEAVATVVDESGSDLSLQNIDPKKLVEIVIQVFQVLAAGHGCHYAGRIQRKEKAIAWLVSKK